jgi:hypothetical protein
MIGSYAISTRPWMSSTATENVTTNKKSKAQPIIIHEIFNECSQLTDDPFWKSVFEKSATGRFPRGFTYKNNILTYKVKTKTYTLEVSSEPYLALQKCVEFMRQTAKISSEADKEREKIEIEEKINSSTTTEQTSWGSIKKKNVKNMLFSNYINKISKMYNFDRKQKETYKITLNIGFSLGYLNKDDIVFEKGEIKNIKGLIYDAATKNYIVDPKRQPKLKKTNKISKTETKSKNSLISLWNDFIDYYINLSGKSKPLINFDDNISVSDISTSIITDA